MNCQTKNQIRRLFIYYHWTINETTNTAKKDNLPLAFKIVKNKCKNTGKKILKTYIYIYIYNKIIYNESRKHMA